MSDFVKVEGFSGLVRDPNTNVVLNVNEEEIELARERKRLSKLKREREQSLSEKVEKLETDMNSIKNSLDLILKKLS